jgi:hypothetical protein
MARLFLLVLFLMHCSLKSQCFKDQSVDTIYSGNLGNKNVDIHLVAKSHTVLEDFDPRRGIVIEPIGERVALYSKYKMEVKTSDSVFLVLKKRLKITTKFLVKCNENYKKIRNNIVSETLTTKNSGYPPHFISRKENFRYVHKVYNSKGKLIKKEILNKDDIKWEEWGASLKDVNIYCAW